MPTADNAKKFSALSVADVAELLGVTDRQVRNWIKDKGLQASADLRGRTLDWPSTLQWYVAYQIEERGLNGGNGGNRRGKSSQNLLEEPEESYEEALARKTRAEADLKELQLARERGEVAAIQDVEKAISNANKGTQTLLLALPSRLSTQLLGLEDRVQIDAVLKREVAAVLGNLANLDTVLAAARSAEIEESDE